jgi:membrane fusion protein (multidrug efflux system)
VRTETWQPSLSAVGSLVATQGVFVANETAGQVKDIHFESGQQVQVGDLLLQLDDEVDRAELAGLNAAQKLAELSYERAARLVKDKSVSRSDYDQARAALDSATALVASQQASIRKKAIRAPFTGQLGIRQVDLGQYLAPGAEIVSLQALDPIYVDYSLPERDLGELSVGQVVEVSVQAYPGKTFAGHISAVSPLIAAGTRSVSIRATLENPDQQLRPGMFAEVRTLQPERTGVMTLPERTITYNPYGNAVFVIEEKDGQQIAQRRQIETGIVRDGRIEILKGLKDGEQIVSAGQNKLRNGQAVKIDNSVELGGQAGE